MRVAPTLVTTDQERRTLEHWARGRSTPARLVLRARIVLRAVQGVANNVIAQELGTDRLLVGLWRKRFAEKGPEGAELAQAASAVSHAFHSDQQFMAEPGGAVVSGDHGQADPARGLPQRAAVDRRHHGLHRRPQ